MNTQEAVQILEDYMWPDDEYGNRLGEALTHAIEHMKRGAPDGWKLVPKEPTVRMNEYGKRKLDDLFHDGADDKDHVHAIQIYKAMLSAAPEPPQERKD